MSDKGFLQSNLTKIARQYPLGIGVRTLLTADTTKFGCVRLIKIFLFLSSSANINFFSAIVCLIDMIFKRSTAVECLPLAFSVIYSAGSLIFSFSLAAGSPLLISC